MSALNKSVQVTLLSDGSSRKTGKRPFLDSVPRPYVEDPAQCNLSINVQMMSLGQGKCKSPSRDA